MLIVFLSIKIWCWVLFLIIICFLFFFRDTSSIPTFTILKYTRIIILDLQIPYHIIDGNREAVIERRPYRCIVHLSSFIVPLPIDRITNHNQPTNPICLQCQVRLVFAMRMIQMQVECAVMIRLLVA